MRKLRFIGFTAIALAALGAQKSDVAEPKKQCDDFAENANDHRDNPYMGEHRRLPPPPPSFHSDELFVCVIVEFDINEKGRTENIEVLFAAPESASTRFSESAVRAVKKWRYDPPLNEPELRLENRVAKITFER